MGVVVPGEKKNVTAITTIIIITMMPEQCKMCFTFTHNSLHQ